MLANYSRDEFIGTLRVHHAELGAVVIAEIEFGKIAMQMVAAAMLVDAFHAALKHAEIPLKGIGVRVASDPLKVLMLDLEMLGKPLGNPVYILASSVASRALDETFLSRLRRTPANIAPSGSLMERT
jgi:hypothetical protein